MLAVLYLEKEKDNSGGPIFVVVVFFFKDSGVLGR